MAILTPKILLWIELVIVYLFTYRIVRSKWFRQCILAFVPVILYAVICWFDRVPPVPVFVAHYALLGIGAARVFQITSGSVIVAPLCVFWGALICHFEWLPDPDDNEFTLCVMTLWVTREFQHVSAIAALFLLPAALYSSFLAYDASSMHKLNQRALHHLGVDMDLHRSLRHYANQTLAAHVSSWGLGGW